MLRLHRSTGFLGLLLGAALVCGTTEAWAATHHARHHHPHHRVVKKHHAAAKQNLSVHDAQVHLIHLGYETGTADGVLGRKTKAAIKKFQTERHLMTTNGTLTPETAQALLDADQQMKPAEAERPDFYATHPDFYGHTNQAYAKPTLLSATQTLPSRYAKLEVSDLKKGTVAGYTVTLNGTPFQLGDASWLLVGISRTFEVGAEDAIVMTSYNDSDSVCPYRHQLMTLHDGGVNLYSYKNCTHDYEAKMNDGSLFVTFPEDDQGRPAPATWRYEVGDLERL